MWQLHQLERLQQINPQSFDETLNKVLKQDQELWKDLVMGAYINEEISLGKAAELLEVYPLELRKEFLEKGIPVRGAADSKEAIIAEKEAAKVIRERFR